MRSLLLLFVLATSSFAYSDEIIICARDFAADGFDMCGRSGQPRFAYALASDGKGKVCVSTYEDKNCKNLKQEFVHAVTPEGKIICVLNFNQPEIGNNYCVADPKRYVYLKDPWANN